MPDADFPNFSKVVICLQEKLVKAAPLERSVPVQMVTSALLHTIQTDANMGCGALKIIPSLLITSIISKFASDNGILAFFGPAHLILASSQS